MTRCRLTGLLVSGDGSCRLEKKIIAIRAGQWGGEGNTVAPGPTSLPSGLTAFSHDVSFSAWGSREQQEAEDSDSKNPESTVRVVDNEVLEDDEEREEPSSAGGGAEA